MELSIEVKELSFFYEKNRPVWEKIHFKIKGRQSGQPAGAKRRGEEHAVSVYAGAAEKNIRERYG